jgi:hypothetical protein
MVHIHLLLLINTAQRAFKNCAACLTGNAIGIPPSMFFEALNLFVMSRKTRVMSRTGKVVSRAIVNNVYR